MVWIVTDVSSPRLAVASGDEVARGGAATNGPAQRLASRRLGTRGAPPVVALHGLASGGVTWLPSLAPLAALSPGAGGARVWLPDLLGHGASPWPAGSAYDVEAHLGALDAWLDAEVLPEIGAEPVTLVGCSTGAVLAAEWARRLPAERVRAVVLVCMPLFTSAAEAVEYFAASDPLSWLTLRHPFVAEKLCRRTCGPRGLATTVSRWIAGDPWRDGGARWRRFPESMFLHSWESVSRTLDRCLVQHRCQPALEALAAAGVPLSFVHGTRDRMAPFAAVEALAERTGARLVALPGGTHAIQLSHPAAIQAEVTRVLQGAPSNLFR